MEKNYKFLYVKRFSQCMLIKSFFVRKLLLNKKKKVTSKIPAAFCPEINTITFNIYSINQYKRQRCFVGIQLYLQQRCHLHQEFV